jgi:hypothetical protein
MQKCKIEKKSFLRENVNGRERERERERATVVYMLYIYIYMCIIVSELNCILSGE